MKKNLYLNPLTFDLTVENFNLKLTSTYSEWLSQSIETEYGEWFANQELGFPYYTKILGKGVDTDEITSLFLNKLKNHEGVKSISSFTIDYDNATRIYTLDFIVISTEGKIVNGGFTI